MKGAQKQSSCVVSVLDGEHRRTTAIVAFYELHLQIRV